MSRVNLVLPFEKARRPGDVLEVQAEWELDGPGLLQLRLCWKTCSVSNSPEPVVVKTETVEVAEACGERRLRVELPDGPWSFVGKLFRLEWYMELENADGISRQVDFVLSPTGEPIRTKPESESEST